jgi:hypothetical protein
MMNDPERVELFADDSSTLSGSFIMIVTVPVAMPPAIELMPFRHLYA